MADQELIMKLSMLQQRSEQIEEQINLINQNIAQLEALNNTLLNIDKSKNKEMLAPLGKGIFVESEIKNKDLFVNVGSNTIVKRTPKQTAELIEKQINEMKQMKMNFADQLEQTALELQKLVEEAQNSK